MVTVASTGRDYEEAVRSLFTPEEQAAESWPIIFRRYLDDREKRPEIFDMPASTLLQWTRAVQQIGDHLKANPRDFDAVAGILSKLPPPKIADMANPEFAPAKKLLEDILVYRPRDAPDRKEALQHYVRAASTRDRWRTKTREEEVRKKRQQKKIRKQQKQREQERMGRRF